MKTNLFGTSCALITALCSLPATALPSQQLESRQFKDGVNLCGSGPGWASVHGIGNSDFSGQHCETQYGGDFTPINGIEVWTKPNGDHVAGIQITYVSGNNSRIYGHVDTSSYPAVKLTLKPGELIKNCIMYGNGRGSWFGAIHIETSLGQTVHLGRGTENITPYNIEVGGGILLGALVTEADDNGLPSISSLALLFLGQEVDHISISDFALTEDPTGTAAGISPHNVLVAEWNNKLSTEQEYNAAPTYSVTTSYEYEQTSTQTYGAEIGVTVEGKLFGIGTSASESFSWEVSNEVATRESDSHTTEVSCSASGTLQPGEHVKVTGTYQTGTGDWKYESMVTVHLVDGSSYQYHEKGSLNNTAYGRCITTMEPMEGSTPPKDESKSSKSPLGSIADTVSSLNPFKE